ncbi:MAG: hypothetical protein GY793_04465 [Proteobacteria bacterium]|nr:hypothetical protein [Pseudomonadota bacterium]
MGDDKGYLDKYEQTEFARGSDGSRSTAKGNSDHKVHETVNSAGEKGHTTIHSDGGIHNHGSHAEKGYGSSWGTPKGGK